MNQLSWLLYFGNVLSNLGPFFVIFSLLFLIAAVLCFLVFYYQRSDLIDELDRWDDADKKAAKVEKLAKLKVPYFGPLWAFLAVLFMLCATFCPSSETVYAIAASQTGEQALKTPLANKAEQALESWLNKQISVNVKGTEATPEVTVTTKDSK